MIFRRFRRSSKGSSPPPYAVDPAIIEQHVLAVRNSSNEDILRGSREAAHMLSDIVRRVSATIQPGDLTAEVDQRFVDELSASRLAATQLDTKGFPAATAISVSPALLHAPPRDIVVSDGDLVTIQLTGTSVAAHASIGWTFPVGKVSEARSAALSVAKSALHAGLTELKEGVHAGTVGHAIWQAAQDAGFSTEISFCGYSMGQERIMPPQIIFASRPDTGPLLAEGTIINLHSIIRPDQSKILIADDNWTAYLSDGAGAVCTVMAIVGKDSAETLTDMF